MKLLKSICLGSVLVLAGEPRLLSAPVRTDINPAMQYYQAFLVAPDLSQEETDELLVRQWYSQKLPPRVGELLERYGGQLKLVRHAAHSTVPCDWGIDMSPGPARYCRIWREENGSFRRHVYTPNGRCRRGELPRRAKISSRRVIFVLWRREPIVRELVQFPAAIHLEPGQDLNPSLANYQRVANRSLDSVDDLIAEQSKKRNAPVPVYRASTLLAGTAFD